MKTDCLIIGSGVAGLTTAISLAEKGHSVTVITAASNVEESNTSYAQGGIIYESLQKDKALLAKDIIDAGSLLNYLPAVDQLVNDGPNAVRELLIKKLNAPFDRNPDSSFKLTREGAHSEDRILHYGDETGKCIEQGLIEYCSKFENIQFLSGHTAINLLMTSYHTKTSIHRFAPAQCFGAFVFDQKKQEVLPIFATATLLATGGVGQLYLHNTNSRFSRGDGIALAARAGARLEGLEYVQFHPTTFFFEKAPRFLITEALRGEGAILKNISGERFLPRYIPDLAIPELAPRDRLARAIHDEMLSTGVPCVYLDISHKDSEELKTRFPFVYRNCLKYEIDITKEPIPVVPGAHYHCGGVWSDLNGATSLPGLWAVGETACTGVHGANRLASTSLLEGLVWGMKAAGQIGQKVTEEGKKEFPTIEAWHLESVTVDESFVRQDWLTLKHTMWNYVGLVKTDARLRRAEGILDELERGIESFYQRARLSDSLIGLRNASFAASLIVKACIKNTTSLGCYARERWEI